MTADILRFPGSMKRGPKVKRGPCAPVMEFPIHRTKAACIAAPGRLLDWVYRNSSAFPGEWEMYRARRAPTPTELEAFEIVERRYKHRVIPIEEAARMVEEGIWRGEY